MNIKDILELFKADYTESGGIITVNSTTITAPQMAITLSSLFPDNMYTIVDAYTLEISQGNSGITLENLAKQLDEKFDAEIILEDNKLTINKVDNEIIEELKNYDYLIEIYDDKIEIKKVEEKKKLIESKINETLKYTAKKIFNENQLGYLINFKNSQIFIIFKSTYGTGKINKCFVYADNKKIEIQLENKHNFCAAYFKVANEYRSYGVFNDEEICNSKTIELQSWSDLKKYLPYMLKAKDIKGLIEEALEKIIITIEGAFFFDLDQQKTLKSNYKQILEDLGLNITAETKSVLEFEGVLLKSKLDELQILISTLSNGSYIEIK